MRYPQLALWFCVIIQPVAAVAQTWTAQYQSAENAAEAVPRFHVDARTGARVECKDGTLVLKSPTEPGGAAYFAIGRNWPDKWTKESSWGEAATSDGSKPTTVEARVRAARAFGNCKLAAIFQASDGIRYWILSLGTEGICDVSGKLLHQLDTTQFHTYRLTLKNGHANLFVDGKSLPYTLLSQSNLGRNALLLGDFSSRVAGVWEWDFVRWTNQQAEPWEGFKMPEIWHDERVEICSPKIEHPFCTGGASVLLSDGRILTTYSGRANPHGQKPGTTRIYARVSSDGGRTWGPECEIIYHPECQASGASILRTRDGTLWAFYLGFYRSAWPGGEPDMDATRSDLWRARSRDDGETWADRRIIFRGYTGATNGAIETKSGNIIVPFSYVTPKPGRLVSACVASADKGKTWKLGARIDLGGHGDHAGALEPTVIELKDGRIWMLFRTTKGCQWQAFSDLSVCYAQAGDNTMTWSEPTPTDIRSPSAPAYITRLASDRLALVWNNTMHTTRGRDTLSLALSEDEGKTWTKPVECVRSVQLSYPFILEIKPGLLLVGCNHVMPGWKQVTPVLFRVRETALLQD